MNLPGWTEAQAASVPAAQAQAHALAGEHRVVQPGRRFLDRARLDAIDAAISLVSARLRATVSIEASLRTAGEWLLDNGYVIRRVLRELRDELPVGFQRRLPRLGDGRPRVRAIAEVVYPPVGRDLDVDVIEEFLRSYQERTELTIAELWAFPAVLRLVIVEQIQVTIAEATVAGATSSDVGGAVGRAVRGLRLLSEVDWKVVFGRVSVVEERLLEDPAAAYDAMDFETRDAYRRAVEDLAREAVRTESGVATLALDRARAAPPDGRQDHVGHWLVGDGRRELERSLGVRMPGLAARVLAHPALALFAVLGVIQLLILSPVIGYLIANGASTPMFVLALLASAIPASVPATMITHWLFGRVVPPRRLSRLDFSEAIPARWRTLVVMPTLIGDTEEVDQLAARLELHYVANPDPELRFALLTDHPDSDHSPGPTEERTLAHATRAIERLNARHGNGAGPFHLLHRAPRWNERERKWMGWERKRGKLDELNRYLRRDQTTSYELHIGDPLGLEAIRFVLTLDADTELPPGTAARLVGALAHPLNRPEFDAEGRVHTGYTVIEPRVEVSPRSARRSWFTRVFSGDVGIDIYTRACSEVYQDLFGEGIFVGKGVYDIDAFRRSVEGRVPENAIVSHDLFEGVLGRAALATDDVIYEDYPPHHAAYLRRMHRWVRGDWQLVPWLRPRVPYFSGRHRNRLQLVDRFKIVDNLRRSLVAPATLTMLVLGWFVLPGHPAFWTVAAVLAPGAGAMWSTVRRENQHGRELARWALAVGLAPVEALVVLDAIGRSLVRMLWTRRGLLEWVTAAASNRGGSRDWRVWVGPGVALAIGGALAATAPASLPWAAPLLVVWMATPAIARWLGRPTPRVREVLGASELRTLRLLSRRTWAFFEAFVGPRENWLPPDHFQEHPRSFLAHRTSPTNIGMLLLAELAAYDLGYLSRIGLASWVANTLETLERLERVRGHIYNWYDTRTLEPLEPRYISTVDSGNLAGALITLAVGCEQAADATSVRAELRDGFRDVVELLAESISRWNDPPTDEGEAARALTHELAGWLAEGRGCDAEMIAACDERVSAIDAAIMAAIDRPSAGQHGTAELRELRIWSERLHHQLAEARRSVTLDAGDAGDAGGDGDDGEGELAARLRSLATRARALSREMDFRFLFDERRRLFHVGFNAVSERLDPHYYDLLASEARLASYLAVVARQAPLAHWFALGRPLARTGRHSRMLMSWGGSMFEYLMPCLLMRSHEDTLLQQSYDAAVARQIAYGGERGTPWGISESGYALLDAQQGYQYRAFGVPGLGLRRGLEEDVVIAPYASVLALPLRPRAVVENLAAFDSLGMLGRYGYYEAVDFHPRRRSGDRPSRVRSYMAHHQGMVLVSITNHLTADRMVQRFHADHLVRSGELLLDERVPFEAPIDPPGPDEPGSTDVALTPVAQLPGWAADRGRQDPEVWAIGNDELRARVTAAGAVGLRLHDLELTRWDPSPHEEAFGAWTYLQDLETGEAIGTTPGPLDGWPAEASVQFNADHVVCHRRDHRLSVRSRITIAASANVMLHEFELSNEGDHPRHLRLTSCLEPSLERTRDAGRHPAFSKLFLRCSPIEELAGVTISRLPLDDARLPVVLFRLVADREASPYVLAVDRERLLGRRGSIRTPRLPAEPAAAIERTLDPLCACAVDLELAPGTTRVVTAITAVADTRPEVEELARRFGTSGAVRWAFEDAARYASRRVTRLDLQPHLLPTVQRLLTAISTLVPRLRAPAALLDVGQPSKRRLWERGISGDDPIVLVRLREGAVDGLLGEVLDAHRYLRALAVPIDLVVIDDSPTDYGGTGLDVVRRHLAAHGAAELVHQRGGVHVIGADRANVQQIADLAAAARVYLELGQGSLSQQLGDAEPPPPELPPFEPAGPPPGGAPDPEITLEVPPLRFDCGFGGFDGDDYVVRPGAVPPAPWCNVIANAQLGCLVSEAALGTTWAVNAGENRLTPWRNDPVRDPASEVLYLRDEETARVWSTTPVPAGTPTLVRHGHGYSSYRAACAGFEHTMTVFVAPDAPLKIVRLVVKNHSDRPRRLTATYYADLVLGTRRAETAPYITQEVVDKDACVLAHTSWSMDFAGHVAFVATDRAIHGFTTDRAEFAGPSGDLARPAALRRWGMSGRVAAGDDPCAALQVHLDLAAGQEAELAFFMGQATDREAALALVRDARSPGRVGTLWAASRERWDRRLGAIEVRTPDAALDRLANRWLPYQALSARFFGRTGFYQSSGAFGFRDQLQDALAFVHCDAGLMRHHLLEAAAHQFVEGDVLHWWHPPGDAGVRTRCSDDLLWLVYVTAAYVEATGDHEVLDEEVPFLAGEPLEAGEEAHYAQFARASGAAGTLLEHCRRALTRGFTAGLHGLPLIGSGDWNDGMNRIGHHGRGESVWLGWFLHACVTGFASLLDLRDARDEASWWRARLPPLVDALTGAGWDGGWYVRAFDDNGSPVGSAHARPPHIDSIAQSWAVLSGAGQPDQIERALAAADELLVRREDRLVLLLAPPFGRHGPDAGYISAYPAGVRENGGQYTHAATWLGWAHAARGDGDGAHRIFQLLNPLERADTVRYRVEPYVLAADVYAVPPWTGRGGWTWYTGAAAWMWRLAVEAILGLRRRQGGLEVTPCLPTSWDGFEAWVRHDELVVHVVVHARGGPPGPAGVRAQLDGAAIDRPHVALTGRGERLLEVWLDHGPHRAPEAL